MTVHDGRNVMPQHSRHGEPRNEMEIDAQAVLRTIHQPLLVLNIDLTVKAANRAFYRLFQVEPTETEGYAIYDLGNSQWDIPLLRELLEDILPNRITVENFRVEREFDNIGRRVMMLNAEMIPAVRPRKILVSINDITDSEKIAFQLETQKKRVEEALINASHDALLILDGELRVLHANRTFYRMFEIAPEEAGGRLIYDLGGGHLDIPQLRALLEHVLRGEAFCDEIEVESDFDGIGRRIMGFKCRAIDHDPRILLSVEDLTERRQEERGRAQSVTRRGFLLELSENFRTETDPDRLIESACAALGERLGLNQVAFFEIDPDETCATLLQEWNDGRIPGTDPLYRLLDFGEAFIAELKRGQTVSIADVREDPRTASPETLALFEKASVQSFQGVPLVKEGRLTAVLALKHATPIPHDATALADEVAQRLWEAVARSRAEARIGRLALYDALTDLPNRTLLVDRFDTAVAQSQRDGRQIGFILLDIDRFKEVNDTLGHLAGDELLQHVARRVDAILRRGDTFARLSGDEFAAILPGLDDAPQLEMMARRIGDAIRAPMRLAGREWSATASMGIAMFPDDGRELKNLMHRADLALYRAKAEGRGCLHFFEHEMEALVRSRRQIEDDLGQALERDELRLVYQPQLDIAKGRVTSVEALVRWNHPQRGLLMPDVFVSVAEETGLIHALGAWVLAEVCRQVRVWRDGGLELRVGVNISGAEARQDGFLATLDGSLAEHGVAAHDLEIEITESLLIDPSDAQVAALLSGLQTRGIRMAIDDFGTGYSALSYLSTLPVSTLKIDRTFVAGMGTTNGRTLIEAMIGLGQTLGKRVVAEGVETRSQLEGLRASGCDAVQGFLISRPLNPDHVEASLPSAAQSGRA